MNCLVLKHVVHLVANVAPIVVFRVILKLIDRNHLTASIVGDVDVEVLFVLPFEERVGHDDANVAAYLNQGRREQKADERLSLTSSELKDLSLYFEGSCY